MLESDCCPLQCTDWQDSAKLPGRDESTTEKPGSVRLWAFPGGCPSMSRRFSFSGPGVRFLRRPSGTRVVCGIWHRLQGLTVTPGGATEPCSAPRSQLCGPQLPLPWVCLNLTEIENICFLWLWTSEEKGSGMREWRRLWGVPWQRIVGGTRAVPWQPGSFHPPSQWLTVPRKPRYQILWPYTQHVAEQD